MPGVGTLVCVKGTSACEVKWVETSLKWWDNPTMTVTADSKKRVVISAAKPGDLFEIKASGEGQFLLTRLEPVRQGRSRVTLKKQGRYTVGVLDRPIDETSLREALADFP